MDMQEKKELGKQLIGYIIVILIGSFLLGFALGNMVGESAAKTKTAFGGQDTNFLVGLAYNQGFCERQGFVSAVLPQQIKDTNQVYGIPVCIERRDTNAK